VSFLSLNINNSRSNLCFSSICITVGLYVLAQETILLEILHQTQIPFRAHKLASMKDEMFIIDNGNKIIVYNRNNFAEVEDIIDLSEHTPLDIAVCNVSNCVYALVDATDGVSDAYSILRITKNEEHQFESSTWIEDVSKEGYPCISVSANGILIIRSYPLMICTYDANGQFQHQVKLSASSPCIGCWNNPIQKSNGNFVLACDGGASDINDTEGAKELDGKESTASTEFHAEELVEFDATGSIVSKFKSPLSIHGTFGLGGVQMAGTAGRFVIAEADNRITLFDAEFNRLEFTGPHPNGDKLHYSSERNEIVSVGWTGPNSSLLTIFRFKEE